MATSALSANNYVVTTASTSKLFFNKYGKELKRRNNNLNSFKIRASADDSDCNTEECAPDKQVGTVSMEWLAGEKTKVVGTFPPRTRGWTGYVEKDTAGQKNIYSVEPAVYVAESAISSGRAGSSADGSENTIAIAGGIALFSIAAASLILLQIGNAPPPIQTAEYSGPSLSYYINKFKPVEIVQASNPIETITFTSSQPETSTVIETTASTSPSETVTSTAQQSLSSNFEVPEVQG